MQTVGEKYFSEMLVSSQPHTSRGRLLSWYTNVVVTYADCRRKVLLRNAGIQPATSLHSAAAATSITTYESSPLMPSYL